MLSAFGFFTRIDFVQGNGLQLNPPSCFLSCSVGRSDPVIATLSTSCEPTAPPKGEFPPRTLWYVCACVCFCGFCAAGSGGLTWPCSFHARLTHFRSDHDPIWQTKWSNSVEFSQRHFRNLNPETENNSQITEGVSIFGSE
jgi:hypothetical protein